MNFGHTIGHAIETSSLNKNKPNLHGYAVAKGMIIESYISCQLNNISKDEFLEIKQLIEGFYSDKLPIIKTPQKLVDHMKSDKKNDNSFINFSLPTEIGHVQIDCELSEEKVLEYVSDFLKND